MIEYQLAVAIPTFNRATLLDEILWIIGPQVKRCYPKCVCYVIDNNSTDETMQIVQNHIERWPGVFYHKNEENIGLVRNIAQSITVPNSKWVWLLGDDDIPMPWGIRDLLENLESPEFNLNDIAFLFLNGAKINENKELCNIWNVKRKDKKITIYQNGAEIVEEGIHSLAWLSKLVINRGIWNQAYFDKIYRETDLYTFVTVLLEVARYVKSASTNKLYVLATDRGSRGYYFSKISISRVCEFPEIERSIFQIFGESKARGILKSSRKNWIIERASFAAKISVFDDLYSEQLKYIKEPISPYWEEVLLIKTIYLITRINIVKKLLRKLYLSSRTDLNEHLNNINNAT